MTTKIVLRPPADDEWKRQVSALFNKMISNIPADSTASDVAGVVSDLNDLLAVLRGLTTK